LFFAFAVFLATGFVGAALLTLWAIDRTPHMDWFFTGFTKWPFPMGARELSILLPNLAMLGILVQRFARSRRDEERLAGELEAARVVQQILIPEELPHIRGLAIETVYKPAGQVGGDFFQVLPCSGQGALIVIGDVSGKGMPAAMTVSLLVGTFRTLAHFTENPSEILSGMNQRMIGRQKDGFVTCLVLRVATDGKLTLANAGHLVPYCNGHEIAVESGLPLGLDPNATYPETNLQLPGGAPLTLMTDGVVEARARDGELFGFDRSRDLSSQSAEKIAQTAQAFGQEDDITVVRITRAAAGEEKKVGTKSALSPTPG
jgi:serine phosphatase RsbU (regulator of sigma subunit)